MEKKDKTEGGVINKLLKINKTLCILWSFKCWSFLFNTVVGFLHNTINPHHPGYLKTSMPSLFQTLRQHLKKKKCRWNSDEICEEINLESQRWLMMAPSLRFQPQIPKNKITPTMETYMHTMWQCQMMAFSHNLIQRFADVQLDWIRA